jgi:hypothetical protein
LGDFCADSSGHPGRKIVGKTNCRSKPLIVIWGRSNYCFLRRPPKQPTNQFRWKFNERTSKIFTLWLIFIVARTPVMR